MESTLGYYSKLENLQPGDTTLLCLKAHNNCVCLEQSSSIIHGNVRNNSFKIATVRFPRICLKSMEDFKRTLNFEFHRVNKILDYIYLSHF